MARLLTLRDDNPDIPPVRVLWMRPVGLFYQAVVLDGSTVIATRHGFTYAQAMRRGIAANLARGGGALQVIV